MRVVQKVKMVWSLKNYFTSSFFYIISMKIQALVILCDEFLYTCIVEICRQSVEPVFNCLLHIFIATHPHIAQQLLQVCEQVKITWSQVQTVGRILFFKSSVMRNRHPDLLLIENVRPVLIKHLTPLSHLTNSLHLPHTLQ
jgi:hypothetical protein